MARAMPSDDAEGDHPINDLIGCVARTLVWMQYALDQQVSQRRATREFAAGEMERLTKVLHLLEDLRGAAKISAEREPRLHLSMPRRKERNA
jgi:hypothetical protein